MDKHNSRDSGTYSDDKLIVDEAVRFMFSNIGSISVLQLFFPVAIAWMFWNSFSRPLIVFWAVSVLALYGVRIVLASRFEKEQTDKDYYPRWARYFTWTSLVSGILWGSSGVLFYSPDSVNLQVLLYVLIVGTAAGSLVVNCYWLPAFFAFSIPAIGMVSLNLMIRAEAPGKILGVLLILYLVIFTQVARRTREMMYHSIRVQFENLSLVEELQRQKERAETANRAKTRFLASANHDLRQPVHALSLMTYAARDELVSPRGKKLYDSMNRTVRSLSQLLESLLDLSRLDAGAMTVQRENVNLKNLGAQLLTEFLPLAQRKELRIGIGPFDYAVYTDVALVERILRNLVSNAVRYTNEGGVLIGCRRRGTDVLVEVWDTGVGIADEDTDLVFTEFYQGNNPDHDRTQGLGLGLSICKRISDLLGHEFTCRSVAGQGTVFRLRLPLSNQVILPDHGSSDSSDMHKDSFAGKSVLVIDDERMVREALSEVMHDWGAKAVIASGGLEALSKLGEDDNIIPDCIICDYRLGGDENGLSAIKMIRDATGIKEMPALILTGDTAPDLVKEFDKSEFAVLHKPVHPEELYSYLSEMLDQDSTAEPKAAL